MASRTIDNARKAMQNQEPWRAKEILRGRVASHGFDSEVFEELGKVLLHMGDTPEAGKYLFLSGVRVPDYAAAINLYLKRYAATDIRELHSSFPAGVRGRKIDELPKAVSEALIARG